MVLQHCQSALVKGTEPPNAQGSCHCNTSPSMIACVHFMVMCTAIHGNTTGYTITTHVVIPPHPWG